MPLRDHFRPPTDEIASWREMHGQWPARIVQYLRTRLPEGFVAAPSVQLGPFEIDIATYERDDVPPREVSAGDGGVATATWAEATATLTVDPDVRDFDEYEVRIYDAKRGRHLVATIEIVSPANKDRPEARAAFVAKCAALIRQGIAVSIVDLVTNKQFNLLTELLFQLGHRESLWPDPPPTIYAASCCWVRQDKKLVTKIRAHELVIGQPLPILPLWLTTNVHVPLELEISYEQACHDLSIP